MRIGFFDTGIESLLFFKEMVSAYPQNDFYFYAETRTSSFEMEGAGIEEICAKAAMYLIERKIDCICVSSSIDVTVFERVLHTYTHDIDVVSFEGFESYAIENNMSQQVDGEGVRSIHLTEHSPTTNERIATLLGGHFIEE